MLKLDHAPLKEKDRRPYQAFPETVKKEGWVYKWENVSLEEILHNQME